MFLMNGFVVGSWAPKIPEFAARLGLSPGELGLMIVAFGIGSLLTMPLVGAWIAREGSHRILRGLSIITAFSLLVLTLAPNIPLAAIAIFLVGASVGGMDVAMNTNAVAVERSMRRAIMSSCHGFWSLGGLIGAALGGYLISQVGVLNHVIAVTALAGVLLVLAWPRVLDDVAPADEEKVPLKLPSSPLPWLIGIMALFSMVPEGAVLDWGALYLRNELGGSVTQSGLVFGAFSATMATMRFAGDAVRDRLGAVTTLRLCAVIAIAGMVIAGLAPTATVAIVGFAICGIGVSNLVPIAFSAGGNLPGLAPGIGMSIVTTMGYSGILVAPTVLGFVAEYTSFAAVFTALPLLLLVVLALSGLARYGDMGSHDRA
ncbi:MAG: MFS transporter [Brucellaceae bacterium]|nr:MFS transporter [Brucellaceae bacterium]